MNFSNPKGFIDTKGIETNVKVTYGDFKLFVGYTLADVKQTLQWKCNNLSIGGKTPVEQCFDV